MSVKVYTRRSCSYCMAAKQLLRSKGAAYEEISLDNDPALLREIMEKSGLAANTWGDLPTWWRLTALANWMSYWPIHLPDA
jgi:arsenate reductase-like glutaredoxin family protein